LIASANAELGKAIDDSKQNNYVYIFNHLTNAWKFASYVFGSSFSKPADGDGDDELYDDQNIPSVYSLEQNYPNPFNPTTKIEFQLPERNFVSLKIYDIRGNLVTSLISEDLESGYYSTYWNASGIASGIYFYRIVSGSFVSTKKMILMK
jgi:hypothetical protein